MEGDAGAGRLNPSLMSRFRRLRRSSKKSSPTVDQEPVVAAEEVTPAMTAGESPESEADETATAAAETSESAVDETTPAAVTAGAETPESEADKTTPAPTAAAETPESEAVPQSGDGLEAAEADAERRPSRVGRKSLAGITAALVLLAGGLGAAGYFALRYHHESQVIARNDAAALKAAVDCVAATQAPDTNAMAASEQKIIECGTGAFRSQAVLYTSMVVQAYQASNVHVQVSDVRAAVQRDNPDGSVEVLVAMRVKVASDQSQKETGYRLKVTMALAEGQYKISKLDQVTK